MRAHDHFANDPNIKGKECKKNVLNLQMKSLTCKQSSASHFNDGAFSNTQLLSKGLWL